MELHLPNKFPMLFKKLFEFVWLDGITNQQTNHIAQHLECCFGHSEMLAPKSIVKAVRYNYIPELTRLRSQTAGIQFQK